MIDNRLGTEIGYVFREARAERQNAHYRMVPKGRQRCRICRYYLPWSSECENVIGTVSPSGWCEWFFEMRKPGIGKPQEPEVKITSNMLDAGLYVLEEHGLGADKKLVEKIYTEMVLADV